MQGPSFMCLTRERSWGTSCRLGLGCSWLSALLNPKPLSGLRDRSPPADLHPHCPSLPGQPWCLPFFF